MEIYITKLHKILILYLKILNLQNLHIYIYIYIDYVEKIILAFFQVYDLFKLKYVYILPISPILNLRS